MTSMTENRISKTLAALKLQGKKALASYIVRGNPNPEISLAAQNILVALYL